jgi:hypothetical protein
MPWALAIGPAAALIGIGAIFFVLRRKAVDKRSMYSARRSQIEHKVRAARQRTLAPHGRAEKPEETGGDPAPASPFGGTQAPVAMYEPSAYEPPPAAAAPAVRGVPDAPTSSPWDVGPTVAPPNQFDVPIPGQFEAPPAAPAYEPEPAAPREPVWTPAPAPAEPATPLEPARPAATAASPAAWSVVGEAKESAATVEPQTKKKKKGKDQGAGASGSWTLASGNAPGDEPEEGAVKPPGQAVAIAQYAIVVVGLIAVLIGVLIMVAGSGVK